MTEQYIVEHDCLGFGSFVAEVKYSEVDPGGRDSFASEHIPDVTTTLTNDPKKAMRFTRLEATLLAKQLDRQLMADIQAAHPDNWQDWVGNYGIWYASKLKEQNNG